jgi:hypothetical protein
VYGSCVWLNRNCRKGKFWGFSFSYISETRTCKFSIESELGCWSSFVMRGSVYRSKCLVDEKREENDRKRNQISPSYN